MTLEWDLHPTIEVPISAIEHFSYCPRQCALIHVEQTFDENLFTIRGRLAHERVESGDETLIRGVRVLRDAPLWSDRLGLRGKADVIEMRSDGPYPVEYKVGRPHGLHADLQLCAQALCLEEMVGLAVPAGAIYHNAIRQRREVTFTEDLRRRTIEIVSAIRSILADQLIPPAPNDARCPKCSLVNACLPSVVGDVNRLRGLQVSLFRALELGTDS